MTQVGNPMTAMAFGVSRLPVDERDGLSGVPGLRFRQFFLSSPNYLFCGLLPFPLTLRDGWASNRHNIGQIEPRSTLIANVTTNKPHKNLLHLYISRPTKTPPSGPRAKLEKARGSRHVILSVVSNLH